MDRHIDIEAARAGLDEIIAAAVKDGTRTFIAQGGQDAVVVLSVRDLPRGDWLEAIWSDVESKGLPPMTMDDIDAEIAAYRLEKSQAAARS